MIGRTSAALTSIIALLLSPSASTQTSNIVAPTQHANRIKVVLVGDSTVASGGGWGPAFCERLRSNVTCLDQAMNGRSTKSFVDEGLWDKALNEHAQFYFIQFGHNDQKDAPELHTDADSTFKQYLRRFISDVKAIGGTPILITSLSRRNYVNGYLIFDGLERYAAATREVATQERVPVIDLYFQSRVMLNRLTQVEADRFDATFHPDAQAEGAAGTKPDRTHLNSTGKEVFGGLVARAVLKAVPALQPYLLSEPANASPGVGGGTR